MYYKILNIHNEEIARIVANNDQDAFKITRELYPTYATIHEISHRMFHKKSFATLLKNLPTITPAIQAVIAIIVTVAIYKYVQR